MVGRPFCGDPHRSSATPSTFFRTMGVMRRATLPVLLAAALLPLGGCEPLVQVLPPAVTLHLSGPAESIGAWTERSGATDGCSRARWTTSRAT